MDRQAEREYRGALDSLCFSGEEKERMMKNLMERQEQRPAKRRGIRPLRAGLIAAALCLALVGTGFAVNAISSFTEVRTVYVERENSENLDVKTVSGYTIDTSGRVYFPKSALSEEARNRDSSHVGFDSWEDAEEYLGLSIADNPVLEQAVPQRTSVSGDGYYNCSVTFFGSINEPTVVELSACYFFAPDGVKIYTQSDGSQCIWMFPDEPLIRVKAIANVYMEDYDKAWERPTTHYFANGGEVLQENYVTPNGLEAVIFTIPYVSGSRAGKTDYEVYFTLNGVEFNLIAYDYSDASDLEFAVETMKEILDAYS